MNGFYVSAAHKSSGKTTLSIGLGAALVKKGLVVQAFKKGPDYIDPMWLRMATGRSCYNLDFFTQTHQEITHLVDSRCKNASIALIEGNKGLFDGMDVHGSDSNAAMAKHLGTPVILVLDTVGTIRGLAPLVTGYQAFDPDITIAGVILNKVGGSRHESKLIQVMEAYTDVPVIGAVGRSEDVRLLERHLGLVPSNEEGEALQKVDKIARYVAECVDLDKLVTLAKPMNTRETEEIVQSLGEPGETKPAADLRLGIARDGAFGFYYADDLDRFEELGAELVDVDTLHDQSLPSGLDGLFIGGGFPESFGPELEGNVSMRESIATAIRSGMPVYAECGGLMYLAQQLDTKEGCFDMVGILPGKCVMHPKPVGRGYIRLQGQDQTSWAFQPDEIKAHEFHYSDLEWQGKERLQGVFKVLRGHGIDGVQDGYRYVNLLAGYAHMRNTRGYPWCEKFIEFVRECKRKQLLSDNVTGD